MIAFPDADRLSLFPVLRHETYLDTGTAGLSTSVHATGKTPNYTGRCDVSAQKLSLPPHYRRGRPHHRRLRGPIQRSRRYVSRLI